MNRFEQARQTGRSLFETEVLAQGHVPLRRLVRVGTEIASHEIADRLKVSAGTEVLVRRRLMLVNDQPVKVTASFFRMDLARATKLEKHELISEGLHVFMEQGLGRRYGRYTEELMARMPTSEEAKALQLGRAIPVIRISRLRRERLPP